MKKIGLICLALVLALGALGVGFAHWSQTITIDQTVETGSVEVGVFGVTYYSEDKDVLDLTLSHGAKKFEKEITPEQVPPAALFPPGTYAFYESVTVNITNLYPSLWVMEDFVIGNAGTVPVKLQVTLTVTDPDYIYDHMDMSWSIHLNGVTTVFGSGKATVKGADGELARIEAALEGMQLHECDVVVVYIDKHLQQEAPQGSGPASFTLTVTGMQWNMY